MSPTQRTLRALRARGYFAEVVERWNPHARIRQDLYRWVDIVAVKDGCPILGVQTTTRDHATDRIDKARGNPALAAWLGAGGRLAVFAWAKHKRKLASGGWSARPIWDLCELAVERGDVEIADGPAALVVSRGGPPDLEPSKSRRNGGSLPAAASNTTVEPSHAPETQRLEE